MFRISKDLGRLTIALCLLALGLYYWFGSPNQPRVIKLRMTAGDGSGLRHRLAKEFAREAAKSGIAITVEPTDGSEAALERLRKREFDIN